MSERPDLNKKLDGETFKTFYYLKEDIVHIETYCTINIEKRYFY